MGGGGAWEIKVIDAHSDADMVDFGLGGSNGSNHAGVGDFAVIGNGRFGNIEDGVGASGNASAYALGDVSEIVGKFLDPGGAVRATD